MCAGVVELVTLEVDLRARPAAALGTAMLGHALRKIERTRPAHVVCEIILHVAQKFRVGLGGRISLLELENERHQRLGDETAAIKTEVPALVGTGAERIGLLDRHRVLANLGACVSAAVRAARMKATILSTSLSPGARSTPEETSIARARVMRKASATFAASSPPERKYDSPVSTLSRSCQSKLLPSPPGRVAPCGARASNRT